MIPTVAFTGTLYRILFAVSADRVLDGVIHPEGRFHHDGQPALYASPTPEAAGHAVARYVGPGDDVRVIVALQVDGARLCDLRDRATCAALGIDPATPSVPWADQRAAGIAATSWRASDAVRATNACGMIYAARTAPQRWHVVLFRWNLHGHARITVAGPAIEWCPAT